MLSGRSRRGIQQLRDFSSSDCRRRRFYGAQKIYIFEIVRVRIKVFHCEGMHQLISIRRYMSMKKMYNGLN